MWRESSTLAKIAFVLVLLVWISLLWDWGPPQPQYISDMEYSVISYEWKEPQLDQSIDGNPLTIHEKHYDKGVGVHAESELSVYVPRGYTHFIAEVGVDDEVKADSPATVKFYVVGDGAVLWESPVLTGVMPPRRVMVNVKERIQLTLKVVPTEDGTHSDHADWGNARFVCME